MSRGGPIVTLGGAVLFLWWAVVGRRPPSVLLGDDSGGDESSSGEPARVRMSIGQRVTLGALGVALIAYELVKFVRFVAASRG